MENSDSNPNGLSEAQLRQRREAAARPKTMTPAAIEQRRKAAELSTGPVTEEGKAISSRNAWKTGEHSMVNRALLWQDIGLGVLSKPCKSTCPKFATCEPVREGLTQPGGDCLDKQVYVEAFDAIMDTLHSGDVTNMHGLLAAQMAGAVEILQQMRDEIAARLFLEKPIINRAGEVVKDAEGKPMVTVYVNPMIAHYYKLMGELGVNLPELLATPLASRKVQTGERAADAVADLFNELADKFPNRGRGGRTIESTAERD